MLSEFVFRYTGRGQQGLGVILLRLTRLGFFGEKALIASEEGDHRAHN